MRTLPTIVIGVLATVGSAVAQITVEVILDQEQFLRDESLPVNVRVINRSGQTIVLGKDNAWLDFALQDARGHAVGRIAPVPVTGEFTLPSAQMATRFVDLLPYFELTQPGRYQVSATVRVKEWDAEATSKAKAFEIVRGSKLWEEEFGVPRLAGPPEVRKYALQRAQFRKQLELYLRVTDPTETRVFRVFPLGPLVSFNQPEHQIDKASTLHVLFQTGARSFSYVVVNPDGEIISRQTHEYTATRPILRGDDTGRIAVAGGVRRLTVDDIPPSVLTNLNTLPIALESAPSNSPPTNTPSKKDGKSRKTK